MALYAQQVDLEDTWGEDNIITWSNRDNTTQTANTVRIEKALDLADEWIDDQFRGGRYQIPFSPAGSALPATIREWATIYAGTWLYRTRGLRSTDKKDKVMEVLKITETEMQQYKTGAQRRLNVRLSATEPDAPSIVI